MFDDVASHFHESVIVAYEEYLKEKGTPKSGRSRDLKLGLVVASALYHFREHLRPPHTIEEKTVVGICPDYGLLRDIVNASKHGKLTRGNPNLGCAEDIEEVVVILELADSDGIYRHVEKSVEMTLLDGTRRRLHDVLRNVINYWIGELTGRGLITARPEYEDTPFVAPTREECGCHEDGAAKLDIEVVQGLRFQQKMQLQRFQTTINVSLSHSETGQCMQREVSLSIEESTRLSRCGSDEERSTLVQTFDSIQNATAEMIAAHDDAQAQGPSDSITEH